MDLIVPTAKHPERADQPMPYEWCVGIDWGSQQHQVCVLDRDRRLVGERTVAHDGASLAQLATWLLTLSAGHPQRVSVAIEVPRGAMVEGLIERGFHVFAINSTTTSVLDRLLFPVYAASKGADDYQEAADVTGTSYRRRGVLPPAV